MERFEYKVVPAPVRGEKIKGAKTTPDRFAQTLTGLMNRMALDGWHYLRADTLPCEERVGFTGKTTKFQHMLIFRRPVEAFGSETADTDASADGLIAAPPPPPQPAGVAPLAPLPTAADGPRIGPARLNGAAGRAPIPLFSARRTGEGAGKTNGKGPDAQT